MLTSRSRQAQARKDVTCDQLDLLAGVISNGNEVEASEAHCHELLELIDDSFHRAAHRVILGIGCWIHANLEIENTADLSRIAIGAFGCVHQPPKHGSKLRR